MSSNCQNLNVGAGGYLTGIDIAPDDTMVVRTDTYGAYIWNGAQWQQLVTSTSMPASFLAGDNSTAQGVYEIQIAPSNTSILYMMFDGYVFKSSDKGTTWTQTSFAQVSANPNDPYRMDGQKMAVDPNNPNVVYVGTPGNGLFVTTNGGTTWQSVGAVPGSLKDSSGNYPGITGIEFDPALGVSGGNTQTIFAASYGNGVYESTNGGASWSAIGGPTFVDSAAVSSTGVYYVVGNGNSLWSYSTGKWTELLSDTSGNGIKTVAVDPFNPNEIVLQTPGGSLNISYNGGQTWSGDNWENKLNSTDIPWLNSSGSYMSIGGTVFDQLVPNKLWTSDGDGVWNTTNLPTSNFQWNTPVTWNDQSLGVEQLVANEVLVPPGGTPVVASWDRAFFDLTNTNAYPSSYGPVNGAFAAGWSLDYASSNPSFLVGIADWWGTEESGYSTNGGQTWTAFPSFIPGAGTNFMGGTIAASTTENFIWAPADGQQPYYTLNGGQTWLPINLPGVTSWSNFDPAYYDDTRTVTADRVLSNTFYLYYPSIGVFVTSNGGATWTKASSLSGGGADSEIEAVPGEAGNLFLTGGYQGSNLQAFYRSTDGGTTWSAVPNVTGVDTFGYGAPAPGQSYPSIYIVGSVNNVYGIWQSNNNAQSWTLIGTNPNNSLDYIKTISGDPNVYGQVYIGFNGSGYAQLSITKPVPQITDLVREGGLSVELTGTAQADSTIEIYDNGSSIGSTVANANGQWSYSTGRLPTGAEFFTAAAAGAAGVSQQSMTPNYLPWHTAQIQQRLGSDTAAFAFAAPTLGYSPNSNQHGRTLLLSEGDQSGILALMGNYMASSFALKSVNHNAGTAVIAEANAGNSSLLAPPYVK